MTVEARRNGAAELRTLAEAWYRQQVGRIELCLGTAWPIHREWIESYLAEEAHQKLIARGWRPKR